MHFSQPTNIECTYNQLADLSTPIFDILSAYNYVIFITLINTMYHDNYHIMIVEAVIIDSKIFVVIHIPILFRVACLNK